MPIAQSITALESSHTTPADIYLFWLAIMENLKDTLSGKATSLTEATKVQIRGILNVRFKAMINEAPTDVYHTGLMLDPRTSSYSV
jgi:hypothetical protein